jgi:hypothetical protein
MLAALADVAAATSSDEMFLIAAIFRAVSTT